MSAIVNCVSYQGGRRIADVEIEQIGQRLKQTDHAGGQLLAHVDRAERGDEAVQRTELNTRNHPTGIVRAHGWPTPSGASRSAWPSLAGTRLMAYSASAVIVRLGLTPGLAGTIEPST